MSEQRRAEKTLVGFNESILKLKLGRVSRKPRKSASLLQDKTLQARAVSEELTVSPSHLNSAASLTADDLPKYISYFDPRKHLWVRGLDALPPCERETEIWEKQQTEQAGKELAQTRREQLDCLALSLPAENQRSLLLQMQRVAGEQEDLPPL